MSGLPFGDYRGAEADIEPPLRDNVVAQGVVQEYCLRIVLGRIVHPKEELAAKERKQTEAQAQKCDRDGQHNSGAPRYRTRCHWMYPRPRKRSSVWRFVSADRGLGTQRVAASAPVAR